MSERDPSELFAAFSTLILRGARMPSMAASFLSDLFSMDSSE